MKKHIVYISLIWLLLSVLIIFAFYTENEKLYWADIPTHFVAGIMITGAMFIASKENIKKTIILSFFIFIAWEFFEITAAAMSKKEFVINIFSESKSNRIQDVFMDTLGLALFFLVYKKYRSKHKAEYIIER